MHSCSLVKTPSPLSLRWIIITSGCFAPAAIRQYSGCFAHEALAMIRARKTKGDLMTGTDPILHLRTSPSNLWFDVYFSEMADRPQAMNDYGVVSKTRDAVFASSVIFVA